MRVASLLLLIFKLRSSNLLNPANSQIWDHLVLASLNPFKSLSKQPDFLVELLVAQFADALGWTIVELKVDNLFVLLLFVNLFLVLFLVVFVLVALAILSSPLFLFGPAFRQLILLILRLTLEKEIFLPAFLVITFNILNDILKLFHLLHWWLLLEAWVAEVTCGHVDAASNVQVICCDSFHAILLLLSSLLGDAVLAMRICVVSH